MAGIVFGGLAVISLATQGDGLGARWTWPLLLIVAGVVGLLATRRERDPDD
jgi:hypothetical protein